jgi:peptidoglycan/LPS O-acetylase OafA/YrhL
VSHHPTGVTPSSGSRLVGIEGLRALAASSIVLLHVWTFSTPGGAVLGSGHRIQDALAVLSVGVTLFFTLSGFLLYRPFAAAIARGVPHLPVGAYLRNRVLRIAPAYWVILLAAALILGSAGVRLADGAVGAGRITDPFHLLQAGLLLQDYRPSTLVIGIGPAWSLAVEAVFYLALPVMVLAVARLARRAKDRRGRVLLLLGPPLLLLVVGLTGKAMAAHVFPADPTAGYGSNWHSVMERSFWAQADLFTFGMLLAVLHTEVADGRVVLPTHWRRIALGLALLIFVPCAWTMHHAELSYMLQNTGEALAITLAFSAIVLPDPNRTQPLRAVRVLESPVLVAIGLASYSLFLWHQPVTIWLRDQGLTVGGWGGLFVNLAIVAVVAGGLSALTYRFVELPALRRKHSTRVAKAPAAQPVTTAAAERGAHVAGDDRAVPAASYPAAGG